jgi:hypothetical protein
MQLPSSAVSALQSNQRKLIRTGLLARDVYII